MRSAGAHVLHLSLGLLGPQTRFLSTPLDQTTSTYEADEYCAVAFVVLDATLKGAGEALRRTGFASSLCVNPRNNHLLCVSCFTARRLLHKRRTDVPHVPQNPLRLLGPQTRSLPILSEIANNTYFRFAHAVVALVGFEATAKGWTSFLATFTSFVSFLFVNRANEYLLNGMSFGALRFLHERKDCVSDVGRHALCLLLFL